MSEQRDFRAKGCQSKGMSKQRDVRAKRCQSKGMSKQRDVRAKRCQSKGMSKQRDVRAKRFQSKGMSEQRDVRAKGCHSKGKPRTKASFSHLPLSLFEGSLARSAFLKVSGCTKSCAWLDKTCPGRWMGKLVRRAAAEQSRLCSEHGQIGRAM